MTLLFADIETDGLLRPKDGRPKMTRIHCICTKDWETGDVKAYWNPAFAPDIAGVEGVDWGGLVEQGIQDLAAADFVVFHNGLGFDVPAIEEFTGVDLREETTVRDTQVLGRLVFPRVGDLDKAWQKKHRRPLPKMSTGKSMFGSQALEAWGHRLGVPKSPAPEFDHLTEEMIRYCIQDLNVTEALWNYLQNARWPKRSVELEHEFAWCINRMMDQGVGFDRDAAEAFLEKLERRRAEIEPAIHEALGKWVTFTPKKKIRKERAVNLNSPVEVTTALRNKFGVKWDKCTSTGLPSFDADTVTEILSRYDIPIADHLIEWSVLEASLARLSTGEHSLMNHAEGDGPIQRIHGYVNHNGARNGRCSHSRPNWNLPKAGTPYAEEFRSLIISGEGGAMVGCDMASADLRLIAHEVAPHDGGRMVEKILEGQIHEWNLENLLRPYHPTATRADAKNGVYAVAYGAQDTKVGKMFGLTKAAGKKIRGAYNEAYPGLTMISELEQQTFEHAGFVTLLDGRRILPDIPYKALAYKVAGNVAVTMKRATVNAHRLIKEHLTELAWMVLHVHDEYEFECAPHVADDLGRLLVQAIEQAGVDLGVLCPMTGEYKVGRNWWEVH